MRRIVALFLGICLVLPVAALAQDAPSPMTWLAFSQLADGKSGRDGVRVALQNKELMDQLVADGVINGYGMAVPANHRQDDDANFMEWVSVNDWGSVGTWVGGIIANRAKIGDDEVAARDKEFMETFVPGSHYDEIARNVIFHPGTPEALSEIVVFYVGQYTVRDGMDSAFMELIQQEAVPVAEQLVADGVAIAYGVHVPEIHGVDGWTHRFWWALKGLDGIGKLKAAYASSGSASQSKVDDLTVPGSHEDTIWMSLFNSAQAADD